MKKIYKKTMVAFAVCTAISGGAVHFSGEQALLPVAAPIVAEAAADRVDWAKKEVIAIGYGALPTNVPAGQAKIMARRTAVVLAQRNALEYLKNSQIDSDTTISDMMVDDVVRAQLSGVIKGAVILEEGVNRDGNYFVKISVPLYGERESVAAAILPKIRPAAEATVPAIHPKGQPVWKGQAYTGVIVDASGLGLSPTFSPVLYDTMGRAIYGAKNIDYDNAIANGMVGYADSVDSASALHRVGNHPLVIRAVAVRGGASAAHKVNVVVSEQDAEHILHANEKVDIFRNASVVFVR